MAEGFERPGPEGRPTPRVDSTRAALERARESFLSGRPLPHGVVRDAILASWNRSRKDAVPTGSVELGHESDDYRRAPLLRVARPVLEHFSDLLATEPVSLVLCDVDGVVLDRRTGDSSLEHYLDRVWLAPGFSYSEQQVGTNGIGVALASRVPSRVVGAEHWLEGLAGLACAATPIRHPSTRGVLGVLNLTCWDRDAGALLAATATAIAGRVEDSLREQVDRREQSVLHDFRHACRTPRHDAVLAISDDLVVLDAQARAALARHDAELVIEHARVALRHERPRVDVELADGRVAQLRCRTTWSDGVQAGGVAVVRLHGRDDPRDFRRTVSSLRPVPSPTSGAIGHAPVWVACRRDVEQHVREGTWTLLVGEPGSGRRTLARAAHAAVGPGRHLRVVDVVAQPPAGLADEVRAELARPGVLVLAGLDAVSEAAAAADVLAALGSSRPPVCTVVVTVADESAPVVAALRPELLPAVVRVPPLRHHVEDLTDLLPAMLARLTHGDPTRGGGVTFSPEAMNVLMRCTWPGNVPQLLDVVRRVLAGRRGLVVGSADLPDDVQPASRSVLTPLEALERDAIVDALRQAGGSKTDAARQLGLSRATIYRKLRRYGLEQ